MLGLQQQHDMFAAMGSPLDYKQGSPQKMDGSPMHHQELGIFQQNLDSVSNGAKRNKNDDMLQSAEVGNTVSTTASAPKKHDKKKGDNNGVKKKKTR